MPDSANQVLNALRDIHLPPPVSLWPLAPGWYVVILLVFMLLGIAFFYSFRWYQRGRSKRSALKKLRNLEMHYIGSHDPSPVLQTLSILLRRVALAYFPREQVAGLEGQAWVDFLNRATQKPIFSKEISQLLVSGPYRSRVDADLQILLNAAKQWVKNI